MFLKPRTYFLLACIYAGIGVWTYPMSSDPYWIVWAGGSIIYLLLAIIGKKRPNWLLK